VLRAAEGSVVAAIAGGWVEIEERMDILCEEEAVASRGEICAKGGGISHKSDDNKAGDESERTRI